MLFGKGLGDTITNVVSGDACFVQCASNPCFATADGCIPTKVVGRQHPDIVSLFEDNIHITGARVLHY